MHDQGMGHIAFGAPDIASYHLHERLRRSLLQRGHTVTVLCSDAAAFTFWQCQGESVVDLLATTREATSCPSSRLPVQLDRRAKAWLARLQPGAERWFDSARPDLLLLHQRRGPDQRLLQDIAQQRGCRVLWCGEGLLPHTLQVDERGLDGDASACQRSAIEFRAMQSDAPFLQACLANALAASTPCALPRRDPIAPALWSRCMDLLPMWRDRGWLAAARSLRGWTAAWAPLAAADASPYRLPLCPFLTVLLQDADTTRVRFDADAAAGPHDLIEAAHAARQLLDPSLELVVVDSPLGFGRKSAAAKAKHILVPAHAAATAASIAVATITINHPMATAGLLAGTPVLHLGAALYGLRGVTTRTTLPDLHVALREAVTHDHPALRQRYLTWLLGYGHVWCSGTEPDHNGLLGFVQAIERRLQTAPGHAPRIEYRKGPAWPLSAPARPQ